MDMRQQLHPSAHGQNDFEIAAGVTAHEMAGPLATVHAALELLQARIDVSDDISQGLLDTASRHVRIARAQTSRLAQLAVGLGRPDTRPTDLCVLAAEVVADLTLTELAHHPTSVEATGPAEAPVDADQIRQALINLLTNAANYSPRGRAIVIAITQTPDQVVLRVKDQGHGVAPEAVERIFERYQRERTEGPGLGLGLALSRDIARSHGGDLALEPAPKGGAVFVLSLPRHATSPG